MIQILLAILSFFLSPMGMFSFGLGLVLFFALPVIPKATGAGRWISKLYLHLATQAISRAAIVVSEHNDIYFKRMSFDSRGVEKITLDGETKEFEDPDGALHYWMGMPFALADEVRGVLFDPRHSVLGERKHALDERDEGDYTATTDEWNDFEVSHWKPGVFEMPKKHELVNLSRVRELVDGGERSEYPQRVEQLYRHSRDPFTSGMPLMKFLMPVIAFVITFGGIWMIVTRLGGGGGSPSGSTVTYGALALIASLDPLPPEIDKKRVAKIVGAVTATVALVGGMYMVLGPIMMVAVLITLALGFSLIPLLSLLTRPISPIAGAFSKLFFRLGFMAFRRPVFEWTPEKYRLREYEELKTDDESVTWYNLFGTLIGFSFRPEPSSWGAEVMDKNELEGYQMVTDGGKGTETNIPQKYVRTMSMKRGDYGAFLPKRLKRSAYYLHTGIATARFKSSAVGEKSLRRLLEAKEKHGENGSSISDKVVLYLTAAGGAAGAVLGAAVFLL